MGIGPSKLVAKVASDAEKPRGFVVLSREEACARFAQAPPGLLPGVGPKTAERLEAHRASRRSRRSRPPRPRPCAERFGARLGPYLARRARFEDDAPVTSVRVAVSESRETTFDRDIAELEEMEAILDRLTGRLCEALVRQDRRGRTIGIKVRLDDFSTHTRARTLPRPSTRPARWARSRGSCCASTRRRGRCDCWACASRASTRRADDAAPTARAARVAFPAVPHADIAGRKLLLRAPREREPLLLIQGMSGNHMHWGEPFLSLIEPDFDAISYDHRGIGRRPRCTDPFSIADLADDAVALLDELDVETAHVMGISMGGMTAQELALRHPGRLRTLTLGCTFAGGPDSTPTDPAVVMRLGELFMAGRSARPSRRDSGSTCRPSSSPTSATSRPSARSPRSCRWSSRS